MEPAVSTEIPNLAALLTLVPDGPAKKLLLVAISDSFLTLDQAQEALDDASALALSIRRLLAGGAYRYLREDDENS